MNRNDTHHEAMMENGAQARVLDEMRSKVITSLATKVVELEEHIDRLDLILNRKRREFAMAGDELCGLRERVEELTEERDLARVECSMLRCEYTDLTLQIKDMADAIQSVLETKPYRDNLRCDLVWPITISQMNRLCDAMNRKRICEDIDNMEEGAEA